MSLLLCCWEMSTPVDVYIFVNFATVLNKYAEIAYGLVLCRALARPFVINRKVCSAELE